MEKRSKINFIPILSVTVCLAILFTPLICGYFNEQEYNNKLKSNAELVVGVVTGYNKGYKRAYMVEYEFSYHDKVYHSMSSGNQTEYSDLIKRGILGRTFPVVVNKSEPEKFSIILITPNDFQQIGYLFPDSLNWVKHIVE